MKTTPENLIQQLSSVLDADLARLAVEGYVEMERRFLAGDWGPAELDGGRLAEAVSQCILQLDSGKVSHTDSPGNVRKAILDQNRAHNLNNKDRAHIAQVIELVYKLAHPHSW